MSEPHILDLTFPMVKHGANDTPWDLLPLLYRGGADALSNKVKGLIANGALGTPVMERLPLVEKLHEVISGKLACGGSRHTEFSSIDKLRDFFSWADDEGRSMTLKSVDCDYIDWTDRLLHRQKIVGDIAESTIRNSAVVVARILNEVLELKLGLINKTRIPKRSRKRHVLGTKVDKQNIKQTLVFGSALLDFTEALSVEAIRGTLPIKIPFRTGQMIEEWSGLIPAEKVLSLNIEPTNKTSRFKMKYAKRKRAAWEADTSLRTRSPLVNLRVQAEMLIFIAQTGMNLAQVHQLRISKFRYQSHIDGYKVFRVYRGRRQGEVSFEIFSEYKTVFERYLAWCEAIFSSNDEGMLFPLLSGKMGIVERSSVFVPSFDILRKRFKRLGIRFISPSYSARRGSTGCCAALVTLR